MRGLSDDEKEKKEDDMKKQADMKDDDPKAYKDLPGDKEAREKGDVKTSKHVKKYHELYKVLCFSLDKNIDEYFSFISTFIIIV